VYFVYIFSEFFSHIFHEFLAISEFWEFFSQKKSYPHSTYIYLDFSGLVNLSIFFVKISLDRYI